MSYLLGLCCGLIALRLSLYFLHQNFAMYFDDVALTMVFGGTLAVGIISAPWHHFREFRRSLWRIVFSRSPSHADVVEAGLKFIQNPHQQQAHQLLPGSSTAAEILKDGQDLLGLQFRREDMAMILEERLFQALEKQRQVADYFMSLAKYPPAFGLVGTVLGLVNLMRAITEGMDPKQTGVKMALALVATLYGLIVANFMIAPVGEAIQKKVSVEQFHAEIIMQAVLLAAEGVSLLKAQEVLNSYLSSPQRVNLIGKLLKEAA